MEDAPLEPSLNPGLYIVATPIGNLGDITLRAADVLRRCDGVACEDTRVAGRLLKHLGASKPLWRYDDHSGERDRARLIASMRDRAVALVSDAGTPLIADPGHRLVNEARAAGVAVTVLPGPCAAIAGLTLSGLPSDRFLFAGFLPVKPGARRAVLAELTPIRATLVFYETGPRLVKTLDAIGDAMPERAIAVARELTKLYEDCRAGSAAELAEHYREAPPRGEIVLLVGPPGEVAPDPDAGEAMLREALERAKPSQAAAEVARATGLDRRELYARALELRGE